MNGSIRRAWFVRATVLFLAIPSLIALNSCGSGGSSPQRPLFSGMLQKITADDAAAGDWFGDSVSMSGDYAIVGAFYKSGGAGAAYIFHRTGTNAWDAGTKITANDAEAEDYFGDSVSISGDYAIVGAPSEDDGTTLHTGAAYIFHRTGTNIWDAGTKITADDAEAEDYFGYSVSISGDYAIVGACYKSESAGAAYIFHRTDTNTWVQDAKILAEDGAASDFFGCAVSISGDYAIVGASGDDDRGNSSGAAYIFHRTGTNAWDAGTKITAEDGAASDWFGYAVSISGDYAIVGARDENDGVTYNTGAAYIFHRTGTNVWDTGTKIVAADPAAYDNFGTSVSISGDYAVVGAPNEDDGVTLETGAAYVFHRTGTNAWDAGTKITANDAEAEDCFGYAVSISGNYAVVGALTEDDGVTLDTGAAYFY